MEQQDYIALRAENERLRQALLDAKNTIMVLPIAPGVKEQNDRLLEVLYYITETLVDKNGGFAVGEADVKDAWQAARAAIAEAGK